MIYFFFFYFLNVKFTLIEYRGLEIIEKEKNPMSHSPEITFKQLSKCLGSVKYI